MGDVLSLAVMLAPILEHIPAARISIWCHPRAAMVFAHDPRVEQVFAAPFPWSSRSSKRGTLADWRDLLRSILTVRKLHIDVAIDTRGDIRSQAMMLLAGCRERIGFTTYVHSNLHLRGLLLTKPLPQAQSTTGCPGSEFSDPGSRAGKNLNTPTTSPNKPSHPQHRFLTNLESLTPLLGQTPSLHLPALNVTAKQTPDRLIVIHPGAGWKYRRWPLTRWAELITLLQQQPNLRIAQIAGPGEQQIAQDLTALLPSPIEIFTTSFDGLLQALAAATVFVGLDSGPMNAATLLDTPAVALFGPGIASMWHPLSRSSTHLQHIADYPCHPCTQITCVRPEDPCINTITVDEVLHEALRVLADARS